MSHSSGHGSSAPVVTSIVALVLAYAVAAALGLPQYGTRLIVDNLSHGGHADTHEETTGEHHDAAPPVEQSHAADEGDAVVHESKAPPFYTVIPFVLLLGAIAVFPLIPHVEHWWEGNLNRFKVAASLGVLTLLYYAFMHSHPIDGHWPFHYVAAPTSDGANWSMVNAILGNALISEFIPFIVLLFSLYTISGGIRIGGDLRANPMTNASFIAAGGLLASFIGTTGAAMVLIRPLLETNKERQHVVHTVVFFIFVVCNCGGCLLPIGDPPLFLGYLEGVSFTWTLHALWKPWLLCNGLLIAMYLVLDEFAYYRRETVADIYRDITHTTKLRFEGLAMNIPLLLGVVLAVALLDPTKTLPGTDVHPWMFSREIVQLALVAIALHLGNQSIRERNNFNYHAIVEVAALFCGIFICMQPALQILGEYGHQLGTLIGAEDGKLAPIHYYWLTGGLSSVLDNAPTYLVFFKTAETTPGLFGELVPGTSVDHPVLVAISLGAVFMGAMTYIGNGPNFMVRAIAEKAGVKMPSFFGYVGYSCLYLLPILFIVAWTIIY
ncbi:sodium:proton antiporter [Aeoliella sp. ICT_H6.2]|uniref:Sodium:proton antiporter n=1 Tax=Aeoliella straminimaris TaxID=2954799 RepID=A0A9X2FGK9_9BACT|nr:sodium:proton antiporter [Aeoliella straminimaris]MCO6047993.1 sodium:proton antiporter [Aeoliella straminimaris]